MRGEQISNGFVGVEEGESVGKGDCHLAAEPFELAQGYASQILPWFAGHDSSFDGL